MTKIAFAMSALALAAATTGASACEWGKKMSKAEDVVTMSAPSPYIADEAVQVYAAGETVQPAALLPVTQATANEDIIIYLDAPAE